MKKAFEIAVSKLNSKSFIVAEENSAELVVRYRYWERMPNSFLESLQEKFNIEHEVIDYKSNQCCYIVSTKNLQTEQISLF